MDPEKENRQRAYIDQLADWSKWLITINFFASTGCVIVLKNLNEVSLAKVGIYLFIAVASFALSVLCATLFTFCMAGEKRQLLSGEKISFLWLAKIQWLLFATGLIFLLIWIAILSKTL